MVAQDLAAVIDIEQATQPVPWTERIFQDCLQSGYQCLVLSDDNELVGFAILAIAAGECHVLNIAIRPERQGQGLGLFLLQQIFAMLQDTSTSLVLLEVRVSNKVAQGLYQKLGFKTIGYRKDYYAAEKGREDAMVMSLQLN